MSARRSVAGQVATLVALSAAALGGARVGTIVTPPETDGYRGIWYFNQPSGDEYRYKYSGGLGTYCAKHIPMAVYAREVNKTFFVYGGTTKGHRNLLEMISYFDHATGTIPRPRILHDKHTDDAHDNPVLCIECPPRKPGPSRFIERNTGIENGGGAFARRAWAPRAEPARL